MVAAWASLAVGAAILRWLDWRWEWVLVAAPALAIALGLIGTAIGVLSIVRSRTGWIAVALNVATVALTVAVALWASSTG